MAARSSIVAISGIRPAQRGQRRTSKPKAQKPSAVSSSSEDIPLVGILAYLNVAVLIL